MSGEEAGRGEGRDASPAAEIEPVVVAGHDHLRLGGGRRLGDPVVGGVRPDHRHRLGEGDDPADASHLGDRLLDQMRLPAELELQNAAQLGEERVGADETHPPLRHETRSPAHLWGGRR